MLIILGTSCSHEKGHIKIADNGWKIKSAMIDSVAQSFLENEKILGFSIAAVNKTDTLFSKSYGHSDSNRLNPITQNLAFPIASATKPHTAVLALKLQEQNLIDLEDYLHSYYPDLAFNAEMKQIKLKYLLNHTSGLPDYIKYMDSLFLATSQNPNISDYFDSIKNKALLFEPGTQFSYTNTGFVFITDLMEKVTGKDYGILVREYISDPLQLSSLALQPDNISKNRATEVFEASDTGFIRSEISDLTYIKGDGGLSVTALELAIFPHLVNKQININQESFNQLTSSTILPSGVVSDYGLGIRKGKLEGHEVWGHTGGASSTWTTFGYFPDHEISVAVCINTDRISPNALDLFGYTALISLENRIQEIEEDQKYAKDDVLYLGNYYRPTDSEESHLQIVKYDNDPFLYRKWSNGNSKGEKLLHINDYEFAPKSAPMDRLVFKKNKQGEIVYLKEYYNGLFMNIRYKK